MPNFLSVLSKPVALVTNQKTAPPLMECYLHCTRWLRNHVVAFVVPYVTVPYFL